MLQFIPSSRWRAHTCPPMTASPFAMIKILLADDEKSLRTVLVIELTDAGYEITATDSGAKAAELIENEEFDVLLLDLNMPGIGGIDVLKRIKSAETATEVIILTGHGTVHTAVEAMKLGAYDFLTKPFKLEELRAIIDKAFEKKRLRSENFALKTQLRRQSESHEIVTKSPLMLEILETVRKVGVSDLPVLVYGESGVGKELIARSVHEASKRAEGPFVAINCGAIAENMIESELFGHEKGSFTGAHARKLGLLEIAGEGTLFLDEIGELPAPLQVKLLRAIETRKFFRVGGVKEVRVSVRFVSATNKDLKAEVDDGRFRADLYYRISALSVHIPPLRERQDDIPVLIEYFKEQEPSFKRKKFSKKALEALTRYGWPGNVRELQNMIHRILLLSPADEISEHELPSDLAGPATSAGDRLEDLERAHVLRVFRETGSQRAKTAERLGIDPKTLYRKLQSYGVKE